MTIEIKRSFLGGQSMGDVVIGERAETAMMLKRHGLRAAAAALIATPTFLEFFRMRSDMRAGGYHRVRLTGARSIDG